MTMVESGYQILGIDMGREPSQTALYHKAEGVAYLLKPHDLDGCETEGQVAARLDFLMQRAIADKVAHDLAVAAALSPEG